VSGVGDQGQGLRDQAENQLGRYERQIEGDTNDEGSTEIPGRMVVSMRMLMLVFIAMRVLGAVRVMVMLV
jgi:hypothetical protein